MFPVFFHHDFRLETGMKRLLFSLVIIAGIVAGCGILGGSGDNRPVAGSYLPLTVGSTWTYAIHDSTDSVTQIYDTVRVSILQTRSTSGKIRSLWQVKYARPLKWYPQTDTMTISIHMDTLFCEGAQPLTPLMLVHPFTVGNKWLYYLYSVVSEDTIPWRGGVFDNSYHVSRPPVEGEAFGSNNYWIEPHVGLVKFLDFGGGSGNASAPPEWDTWTLLSYKINT